MIRRSMIPVILIFAAGLNANDTAFITPVEAIDHVGDIKTVTGVVVGGKYISRSRGKPTFLNLDRAYPDHVFTVLIWGDDRYKFKEEPERLFYGKRIKVTGLIIEYNGIAEIVVMDPSQIKIDE